MADDLKHLVQDLKISDDALATSSHLVSLTNSLTKEGADRQTLTDNFVNAGLLKTLVNLLQKEGITSEVQSKVAELVAELAKTEVARKPCTELPLIPLLVQLMLNNDPQVALQACRALGNICYDNDNARSVVNENKGTETLLQLLKKCLSEEDSTEQLRGIATGFLLNLTNTYETTQEKVLEAGVIDVLCEYLERYPQDEDLCTHILLTLNCITDSELGRQKLVETNMCQTLIRLLEKEVTCEVIETVLELLGNLAESDAMKFQLATSNLCSTLTKMMREYHNKRDDESVSIVKTACDLIILLLTGDDSMVHLYNHGEGPIYRETISWLGSEDETLQIAGALAVGNFARKDEHCTQMVASGLTNQLTTIIQRHNSRDGDIRLQHATLSALRNLAIPVVNKTAMTKSGVVDAILPMAQVETFPVVFKLLGTLRMLVDKQDAVACSLGQNEDFIHRLIEWCNTEDHPGVKGEANRLLAWIIKNSKSSDVMRHIVESGGVPFLVSMAMSEHAVMQSEALIALALTATSILEIAENDFRSAGLVDQITRLLSDASYGPEVKENTLTLVITLHKSEKLMECMRAAEIGKIAQALTAQENSSLTELAKKVEQLFESG